jgi:hypothetical protein
MSSIASLFGPTAEEIVYSKNQEEKLRQQAQLQQSLAGQETQAARDFYQSGYNIAMGVGKGLAGAFGYSDQMQDPRIAKSIAMRKVFSDLSAEDLNDPSKISMISQLADQYDLPELKLWSADRERQLIDEEAARRVAAAKVGQKTYTNQKQYERLDGTTFMGGMYNGQIYEFVQGEQPKVADEGSIPYVAPPKSRQYQYPSIEVLKAAGDFLKDKGVLEETWLDFGTNEEDDKAIRSFAEEAELLRSNSLYGDFTYGKAFTSIFARDNAEIESEKQEEEESKVTDQPGWSVTGVR